MDFVLCLVCDGLSANRSLFRLHQSDSGTLPYKVQNPYSDNGRELFFFSDPPHLIKTARNAWENEKRNLWVGIICSDTCKKYYTVLFSSVKGKIFHGHICSHYIKRIDLILD